MDTITRVTPNGSFQHGIKKKFKRLGGYLINTHKHPLGNGDFLFINKVFQGVGRYVESLDVCGVFTNFEEDGPIFVGSGGIDEADESVKFTTGSDDIKILIVANESSNYMYFEDEVGYFMPSLPNVYHETGVLCMPGSFYPDGKTLVEKLTSVIEKLNMSIWNDDLHKNDQSARWNEDMKCIPLNDYLPDYDRHYYLKH